MMNGSTDIKSETLRVCREVMDMLIQKSKLNIVQIPDRFAIKVMILVGYI